MADMAVVGLEYGTGRLLETERTATASMGRVAEAGDKASGSVRRTTAELQAATAQLQKLGTPVKAMESALLRMGFSEEQVATHMGIATKATTAQTAALGQMAKTMEATGASSDQMKARLAASGATYQQAAAAMSTVTTSIGTVQKASTAASGPVKAIQGAMNGLLAASIGLPGPIGRIGSVLSSLAIGGGITLAVTAGITAIGFAYEHLTRESRKAREETEDLITSLRKLRDEATGATTARNRALLGGQIAEAEAELLAAKKRQIAGRTVFGDNSDIDDAKKKLDELYDLRLRMERQIATEGEKSMQAMLEDGNRVLEQERQRRKQITDQRDALREMALARRVAEAEAMGNELASYRARMELEEFLLRKRLASLDLVSAKARENEREDAMNSLRFIERRRQAMDALAPRSGGVTVSNADQEWYEVKKRLDDEVEKAIAVLKSRQEMRAGLIERSIADYERAGESPQVDYGAIRDGLADAYLAAGRQMEAQFLGIFRLGGPIEAILRERFATAFGQFEAGTAAGFGGLTQLAGSGQMGGFAQRNAKAVGGFGAGVAGLLGGRERNTKDALLQGGLSGFTMGGPLGAAIGAGAGLLGSLFGDGGAAERAQAEMRRAKEAFGRSLQEFAAAALGSSTEFSRSLSAVTSQAESLKKQARDLFDQEVENGADSGSEREAARKRLATAYRQIEESSRRLEAQLRAENVARLADLRASLEVRALTASGRADEAASLSLQIDQAKEFRDLQKELGDQFDGALQLRLREVQALERERLIRDQLLATMDRTSRFQQAELALSSRETRNRARSAAINGDPVAAAAANREADELDVRAQAKTAKDDAIRQLVSGEISIAFFERLAREIDENLTLSLAELEKQAAETAAAIAKVNLQAREDLQVRLLAATGRTAEAQAMREEIDARREYEEAVAAGWDKETLAMLKLVQQQEAIARTAEKAAAAAEALARATEDLTVRHLRATDAAGAADDAALIYQQHEEIRKAIEAGRDATYIERLKQVQADERAKRDRDKQKAQQEAFANAIGDPGALSTLTSQTSVNLAVGASESTTGQLVGMARSQVSWAAQAYTLQQKQYQTQVRLVALTEELVRKAGGSLDNAMAIEEATAAANAGNPPSNRPGAW